MPKADLHMHSVYSDGLFPPAEVAARARAAGAEIVALSDHDTFAGIPEMDAACAKFGIRNIHAVEVSTFSDCEVHILGYNIDIENAAFVAFLDGMAAAKEQRIATVLERLAEHGMSLSLDAVKQEARTTLSRAHVARALVRAGYLPDVGTAFEEWLYEGGPCFVPNGFATPERAIDVIHAAGGVAVLAHPMRIKRPDAEKAALVQRLHRHGLDGIEARYKTYKPERAAPFIALAEQYNLFVTCGGDFHGGRSGIVPRELDRKTCQALGLR